MTKTSPKPDQILDLAGALRLAVVLVDARGHVAAAAPRAEALLGLEGGLSIGRALTELTPEPEPLRRFLRECRRSGSMLPGSIVVTYGHEKHVIQCDGVRMSNVGETGPGVLLLLRPRISEGFTILHEKLEALSKEVHLRRQIELEYRKLLLREKNARRMAEEADRMKDEFLAIVSHELRTPLNAVLSWTQILQMEYSEGSTADALGRIERNARAQAELIEDLLDTSRIVSNQIGLAPREVVAGDILREALDTVRPQAEQRRIRIEVEADSHSNADMDPARIRQVLRNLLENAIKFSEEGGRVVCSAEVGPERVKFSVRDEGRGLREEELDFVFDRFRQVDRHSRRKHGGLGLGLAIAKQLVELHGGRIFVESSGPGRGAAFSFELPRSSSLPMTFDTDPDPGDVPDGSFLRRLRLLVVEDNDDARDALVHFLERFGAHATGVRSVPAAFAELEAEQPHLILSDLQMPGENGYDLLRRLRSDQRFAKLPVLALTAHARVEDRAEALASGFDAYLAKPVAPADLLRTLEQLCERAG